MGAYYRRLTGDDPEVRRHYFLPLLSSSGEITVCPGMGPVGAESLKAHARP